MAAVRRIPVILLIMLPVVLVGAAVVYYAVDIPYRADYSLQNDLLQLRQQNSAVHTARQLFTSHEGQPIFWTRLVFLVCLALNGTLSYYALTLTGFAFLIVLLALLYAAFRRAGLALAYFIPVPFWLFSLQSYETLLWSTAALQAYSQMAFVLATFYLLARNRHRERFIALVPAVLALFSGNSGLPALIAGLLILFRQQHWRSIMIWSVVLIGCLSFYGYSDQPATPLSPVPLIPLPERIESFFHSAGLFADLTGAIPGRETPSGLLVGLGIVLVLGTVYFLVRLAIKAFNRQTFPFWDDFFLASGLFLLMLFLSGIPAGTELPGTGLPGAGLPDQSRLYSAVLVSILYLYSVFRWRFFSLRRWEAIVVTLSTVVLSLLSSYWSMDGIVYQHRQTIVAYLNWLQLTPAGHQRAIRTVYVPTATPFVKRIARLTGPASLTIDASTQLDSLREEPDQYVFVQEGHVNPTPANPDNGAYILLTSLEHRYLFAAWPAKPNRVAPTASHPRYTPRQFYAQIPKEDLRQGRYRIGILTSEPDRASLAMTNQYLIFTPSDQQPEKDSAQPMAIK
ncbi:hypothetical protein GCM10023189_36040 [Nibrella saemangeumensis]|uniref:4-amino-4-deoxy-L-arabinose transferase n=1 Tax=Nibrella saemangeumensis TaxID=1084526 RepID=A0ABP8N3I3_9BACT